MILTKSAAPAEENQTPGQRAGRDVGEVNRIRPVGVSTTIGNRAICHKQVDNRVSTFNATEVSAQMRRPLANLTLMIPLRAASAT